MYALYLRTTTRRYAYYIAPKSCLSGSNIDTKSWYRELMPGFSGKKELRLSKRYVPPTHLTSIIKATSFLYYHLLIPVITLHLSIVAKKHSIATITKLQSLELPIKTPLLHILYCIMDWHMIFGLEQEGGSLIAPMALAHPLHPIDNRSRNKRRNLWVGRCVSSWWPWFPSRSSV